MSCENLGLFFAEEQKIARQVVNCYKVGRLGFSCTAWRRN